MAFGYWNLMKDLLTVEGKLFQSLIKYVVISRFWNYQNQMINRYSREVTTNSKNDF